MIASGLLDLVKIFHEVALPDEDVGLDFSRRKESERMASAALAASAMESVASTTIGGVASEVAKTGVRAAAGDASEDPVERDVSRQSAVAIKAVEIVATAAVTGAALFAFSKVSDTMQDARVRIALATVLAVSSAVATAFVKTVL